MLTEIVEENNYYPFGLKHRGYNFGTAPLGNSLAQKWKFGGKELDESFNGALSTYDFGARNYDPPIGRWMNIDPLAEQMRRHSPYNYAFDNPIYFVDPDGMMPNPILRALLRLGKKGVNFTAKNSKGQLKPISRVHAEKLLRMKQSVFKTTTGSTNKKAKQLMKQVAKDKTVVRHDGHKLLNKQGKETGKVGLDHFQKKSGDGSKVLFDNAKNSTIALAPAASESDTSNSSTLETSNVDIQSKETALDVMEIGVMIMDFFVEGHDDGSNPEGELIVKGANALLNLANGDKKADFGKDLEEIKQQIKEERKK
jgi:RHS repeat-associated protein